MVRTLIMDEQTAKSALELMQSVGA
jgi:hypothetical protein